MKQSQTYFVIECKTQNTGEDLQDYQAWERYYLLWVAQSRARAMMIEGATVRLTRVVTLPAMLNLIEEKLNDEY